MKKSRGDRDFFGVLEQRKALKMHNRKSQINNNKRILYKNMRSDRKS